MRVDLNRRPSYFFLFEPLKIFIVRSISASGAREGGQNLEKEKVRIVCQYVHVEQYEARREHISSLALGGGGGGDWFLCSLLLRRIFQGERKKMPRNNFPMSPFF